MLHCWARPGNKINNIFTQNIAIYMYMHITLTVHVIQLKREMYYNVESLLTD